MNTLNSAFSKRRRQRRALEIEAGAEKGKTIFPKEDGKPFVYSYQIRRFFKAAAGFLQRCKGEKFAARMKMPE